MIRRNRVSHLVGRWSPVYFSAGGSEWRLIGHAQIEPRRRWRKRAVRPAPASMLQRRRPIKRKPPRMSTLTLPALPTQIVAKAMGVPYTESTA